MFLRLILMFIGIGMISSIIAQNVIPDGFSFQSIARDVNGNIAPNRAVYIQVEIIKGSSNPVSVYTELHQTNTSSEGIFNIIIGNGNQPSSNFSAIKWADAPYSLKIKMAVTPLSIPVGWKYQDALVDAGIVQLLSVPYAKVAGNGIDSTKVFFLRDTTTLLGRYLQKDSLEQYLNNKLNVSDSLTRYVTPSQLKSGGYDTSQMLSGYLRKTEAISKISIDSLNGVSGIVKNAGSTPSILISLGNISPTSVKAGLGTFDTLKVKALLSDSLSGTIKTAAQPNITSIGILSDLSVSGAIKANIVSTNTLQIKTLAGLENLSVTGRIEAVGVSGTLLTGVQPNITSLGQLSNLSVSGTINGGVFNGTLSNGTLNNITSLANLTAITVTGKIIANMVSSVDGTMGNLSVPGSINAGSINATNANLSSITGLNALTLTGNITSNAVSSVGGTIGNLSVPGIINAGNVNATSANLTSITGLNALTLTGSITSNTVSSVGGTIGNLSVPGIINAGNVNATNANLTSITGLNALTLTGNITSSTVSSVGGTIGNLSVPGIINAGNVNATNANLTSITGLNALTLTGNITSSTVSSVGGTIGNLSVPGIISAGNVNATNANLTSITGLNALTLTGNITSNAVSSVGGTIGNLSVPGIISAGNVNATNANLTSITGLNALTLTGNITSSTVSSVGGTIGNLSVPGTITAGNVSGTLVTAIQPNITSVGNLSSLNVVGTILANTLSATTINVSSLAGLNNLSVTNSIEASTLSGTLLKASQPNITSLGQLTNLSVTGIVASNTLSANTATINNISGLNLSGGSKTDSIVTVSGGVLRKVEFVSTLDTFTSDFVVNGVANYLKWVNGETVPARGKTAIQLLQEGAIKTIHPTYSSPTLSIGTSPSAGNVEIGSSISVTLNSTFTQNDGGSAVTTTYKKNGTAMGSNTDNIVNITSAISYAVTVGYGQGACKNDNLGALDCTGRIGAGTVTSTSVTYTPLPARYWGYSASASPTDVDVRSVAGGGSELSNSKTKSSFNISIPGSSNHIFFAYPASLGTLSSISVGGFESISVFTLTTRTLVNASGYSQSYHIYVSNNSFSTAVTGIITN